MLLVEGLTKNFGGLAAVSDVSMSIQPGELVGLIGPNGAGKTTFFNLVTGTYRSSGGRIVFKGEDITHLATHKIAQRGIARSFQQTYLFAHATVLANVMMGCHIASAAGPVKELLHTKAAREMDAHARRTALEIIDFMGLTDLRDEPAGTLPHGHQRSLGVAIALACAVLGSFQGTRAVLRLRPAEAMRPKPPRKGGAILLERGNDLLERGGAGRLAEELLVDRRILVFPPEKQRAQGHDLFRQSGQALGQLIDQVVAGGPDLTAIDDFETKGASDPVFTALAEIVKANNGLWSAEAERYLLDHAKPI